MHKYQQDFIDLLEQSGALKVGAHFKLKSGRSSPYRLNLDECNDGESTRILAKSFASSIWSFFEKYPSKPELIYGIPEKGIALAPTVASAFADYDSGSWKKISWFFTRKMPKGYGEATNLSKEERRKALIVGKAPKDRQQIVLLDDVFTTGDTKYEAVSELEKLVNDPKISALFIAVDRQEADVDGKNAIEEFTHKTEIPVHSIVTASQIYHHLKAKGEVAEEILKNIKNYLKVYGTDVARKYLENL